MKLRETLRTALESVSRHRLRAALTALGVVISVSTIIAVVAIVFGINDMVLQAVPLRPDTFVVTRFGIIMGRDQFVQALKRKHLTEGEAERVRELCESCGPIAMALDASLPVRAGGRRIASLNVVGSTANFAEVQGMDLDTGRWFTDLEDEHRSPVIVIGSEIREELFPRVDPIGRSLRLGAVPYTVIGLLPKQGSILGNNRDLVAYVPFRALRKQIGQPRGPFVSGVDVFVRAAGGVDAVSQSQDEVMQIYRWLRHTPLSAPDPVGVITQELVATTFRQLTFATFMFVVMLAGISLFVGSLVVANIMLVSVVERTREIGVRLALGARKRDIRRQFLYEAIFLTLCGGVVGIGVGWAIAFAVRENTPMPATLRPWVVMAAMGVTMVSGVMAGMFPARRAANLTPVEALRHE